MTPKHAGAAGIRVSVPKTGAAALANTDPRLKWTSIYVPTAALAELLALTDGNTAAVTAAVRKSAQSLTVADARDRSRVCVAGALKLLKKAQTKADALAAIAAAENNAAWSQ